MYSVCWCEAILAIVVVVSADSCDLPLLNARTNMEEVYKRFNTEFRRKQPVVIDGLAGSWPASVWSEAEWKHFLHDMPLPLRKIEMTARGGARYATTFINGSDFVRTLLDQNETMSFSTSRRDGLVTELLRSRLIEVPKLLGNIQLHSVQSIGGAGQGQGYHNHEESWFALLLGSKEWFLRPPEETPRSAMRRNHKDEVSVEPGVLRCVQHPGHILYFPDYWWHATYNLEQKGSTLVVGIGYQGNTFGPMQLVVNGDVQGLEAKVGSKPIPTNIANNAASIAALAGHTDSLQWLLEKRVSLNSPSDVDITAQSLGLLPMHQAALHGHVDVLKWLLAHGCSLADQTTQTGHHPLVDAVYSGHAEATLALLEMRADVNAQAVAGRTAVFAAAGAGHVDMLSLLVQHGASPVSKDSNSMQPVHEAAYNNHVGVVSALLEHKASIEARAAHGDGPIHAAAMAGHVNMVVHLVGHRSEITSKDHAGSQPLHIASNNGHSTLVSHLLENKADPDAAVTNTGDTSMHLAVRNGYDSVLSVLLHRGADCGAYNEDGASPFGHAVESRHPGHEATLSLLKSQCATLPEVEKHQPHDRQAVPDPTKPKADTRQDL